MKHRPLVDDVGYTLASVEDILERGEPGDRADLKNAVVAEPSGALAALVLEVYGYAKIDGATNLWTYLIRSLQNAAERPQIEAEKLAPSRSSCEAKPDSLQDEPSISHDDDHVARNLIERFESVLQNLEISRFDCPNRERNERS